MKITTLLFMLPITAAAAGQVDMPEITIAPATVAAQPAKPTIDDSRTPVRAVTRGFGYMIGAIVCPDYDRVGIIWSLYGESVQEHMLAAATKGQSELLHGKAYMGPNVKAFGCEIVPAGTPVLWERDNIVPVISGTLPNGNQFRGVTMHQMVTKR
jgi:hypothetical protein